MRICPTCRTAYPDKGQATCSRDGARLVDAREFADAQADPLLNKVIAGRYRILERVGTGGMGTVYRATQEGLERDVALKILKQELSWDQDTVTRFHREAKAMSLLTHANTVRVFDFGETDDGLLFFAMELLEGELLTSRVERNGALDVVDAIRMAQQILRSLHEAHSKGIVHRDLKPDNIFLAQVEGHAEPVVKVLDFGIAKVVQGDRKIDQLETQAGTVFGTPRYMSPEQAQGKKLDPRSDLYSVGVLLYHMLTGRAPFLDDDAVVVMAKHIREKPIPPRKVAPDRPIPARLERMVMKAVEKDRNKRFKSAEAFDKALEEAVYAAQLELEARNTSHSGRLRAVLREAPRLHLALGAAVVAAAIGVSTYLITSSAADADDLDELELELANPPPDLTVEDEDAADVVVRSDPSGAEVWWEGSVLGTTPLTVRRPLGSRMLVELRREGFESARAELIAGAEPQQVRLTALAAGAADERPEPAAAAETEVAEAEPTRTQPRVRPRPRQRDTTATMRPTVEAPPPHSTMVTPMNDEPYEMW